MLVLTFFWLILGAGILGAGILGAGILGAGILDFSTPIPREFPFIFITTRQKKVEMS
jgi:hypothetical protein